jgi:hypothetical protein
MPQAPLTISQASDALDVSIQKFWLKDKAVREEHFRKYYNVTTGVTDYYMKDSSLSGLGEASRIVENAVIRTEVPVQGFDQTYTQVQYGKIQSFTWYMWKFGIEKRSLTRVVKALRDACYRKRERMLAEKLDAAYLTAYTHSDDTGSYSITVTGGDGVALASASHTREDGGTAWSNIVNDGTTANMNLDYPGLKAAHRIAARTKNPKGQPMVPNIDIILVKKGSAAAFRAKEILGALRANKIPGEFSNDGAAIGSFELVENEFLLGTGDATSTTNLSSETNWHTFDKSMISDEYGLQYFESQPIQLDEQNIVYKTNEIQYKATLAFAYGHNDPRGTLHSTGANS